MTRETKVGLLVGLGVILLIGIIISDHLSVAQRQETPPGMTGIAEEAQNSIHQSPGELVLDPDITKSTPDQAIAHFEPSRKHVIPSPLEMDVVPREESDDSALTKLPVAAEAVVRLEDLPSPTEEPDQESPTLTLGNVPQHRLLDTPPPRKVAREVIHYVESGESLYEISQKYYGDGEQWHRIMKRNPNQIGPNGRVQVGVRLLIPNRTGEASSTGIKVATGHPTTLDKGIIEVKPGDTLSGLAERHLGSSKRWRELLNANRKTLNRPGRLQAGMKLVLPTSAATSGPPPVTPRVVPSNAKNPYKIQPGDNLTRIAESQLGDGSRWHDIFAANRDRLANADTLRVGQEILMPD
jgi:nucleoid-associated protein YgaU